MNIKSKIEMQTPSFEMMLDDVEYVRSNSRIETETLEEWMREFFERCGTWLNADIVGEVSVQNTWIMLVGAGLIKR